MATLKKKPSAKRAVKKTVKSATKTQAAAANTAAHATKASAQWANKSAAEWQKGASEWAKQGAKLYQFPSDAGDVAKNAAASVQSATENMFKASSDMMNQFFGQAKKAASSAKTDAFSPASFFQQGAMPDMTSMFKGANLPDMTAMFKNAAPQMQNFDPSKAQEKLSAFARESAEQLSKSTGNANRALTEAVELGRENAQVAAEVTNVAVAVSKEVGAEFISYLNKTFSQNIELSKQVLTCRTLNDMFDLATQITKTNLDGFFSESVKLSEKLFQCATDVSEPLNERVSTTTERMNKALAA